MGHAEVCPMKIYPNPTAEAIFPKTSEVSRRHQYQDAAMQF